MSAVAPAPIRRTTTATATASAPAPGLGLGIGPQTPSTPPPPIPPPTASPSPPPASSRRTPRPDPLSDKTTTALIRRVLCAQEQKTDAPERPIDEVLPPLTSRNDVDLQLYAIIAIIVREYVQSWYAQITPDETFVEEVVRIFAHCTRALEQRLRNVDLESLLLDELPDLVDRHVSARRASRRPLAGPPIEVDPRQVYHALCPVPQLSPVPGLDCDTKTVEEQEANETAYRQLLAEGVLAILLPTEDLENPCLTTLVVQILAELIVGNVVANKLAQPWMVYEILCILTRPGSGSGSGNSSSGSSGSNGNGGSSSSNGRRTRTRRGASGTDTESASSSWSASIKGFVFRTVHWVIVACTTVRMLVLTAIMAWYLPPRLGARGVNCSTGGDAKDNPLANLDNHNHGDGQAKAQTKAALDISTPKAPILGFRIWSCVANLMEMDARMPWLQGALSMLQFASVRGPGRVAGVDGVVDRLLSHLIGKHLLDPSLLPAILRSARASLFPNNAPSTAPGLTPPRSDAELRVLRKRCAASIAAAMPRMVKQVYFGRGLGGSAPSSSLPTFPDPTATGMQQQNSAPNTDATTTTTTTTTTTAPTPSTSTSTSQHNPGPPQTSSSNTPPPPPVPPTDTTKAASTTSTRESTSRRRRRRAAATSTTTHTTANPSSTTHATTTTTPAPAEEEEQVLAGIDTSILDVFADAYCNKHLAYAVLELVLVRLMPELAEKGVADLWEERLS